MAVWNSLRLFVYSKWLTIMYFRIDCSSLILLGSWCDTFFYKQNVTYFKLDGHYVNASVLFSDLLAGNGMIHAIDKIMWHVGDYQETRSVSGKIKDFPFYCFLQVGCFSL